MNYELILRYTRAYILVVDRSLTVIYNNRGDSGMKLDNPFLIEAVTKALREKESFDAKESRMMVPNVTDFEPREIDVWVKGEYMVMDSREYIVLTITDITSIKEERNEYGHAISEAKNEAICKSSFLANMSHEIRTPLNAILGFSKLLMGTDDPTKQAKYCEVIENNTRMLQQLIDDVLDIAKMESGTLKYHYETVDLNELIESVDSTVRMRVQPNTILNHVLGMADYKIVTDRDRLSQVLINLLTNACKFTPRGSITFGYEEQDDKIYFFVKDTGIGIPKEKQELLFQRFSKQNDGKQGTGLGLSICKNIIETMHGEVGMKSGGEGKGSLFWFTIPLVLPEEMPEEASAPADAPLVGINPPEPTAAPVITPPVPQPAFTAQVETPVVSPTISTRKQRPTIMVAEDNESNYLLFESILEDDFNLIHAWNGREAVDLFKQQRPDLILMDISMPYMDGYEATRNIRKSDTEVPIIAVTAYAFSSDKERIMENGFNSYVSKPVNADRLLSEIQKCQP